MDLVPSANNPPESEGCHLSAVYLYFYTDSVAFPRLRDQSLDQVWPFLLAERIRTEFGTRVFPCMRGLGGGTVSEIGRILTRDSGYFRAQGESTRSIAIFNIGVVDAAPQPFTYGLRKIATIPRFGPKVWRWLQALLTPHRRLLQRIYSYHRTSPMRFSWCFERMVRQANRSGLQVVSIDTPLTPLSLEQRSPGLRDSIMHYNRLKRACAGAMHLSTDWVRDEHYLECGHHFNLEGNMQMAEHLFQALRPALSERRIAVAGQ